MKGLAVLLVVVGCGPRPTAVVATGTPEFRASGRASCSATVSCYERCKGSDLECMGKCDRRASPDAFHASQTLFGCIVRSGCNADPCVRIECNDELHMCGLGIELATEALRTEPGADPAVPTE